MINLNHLKYFYTCARHESLTKAAQVLGITQPALSIQIKQFEESLGFKLFSRSSKQFTLTPKGKDLYRYATRLFEVSNEIELFIRNAEYAEELKLRIGVSDEVDRPFVAEVAGRLTKSNQGKKLSILILSNKHDEITKLIHEDALDIVITNREVRSGVKIVNKCDLPVMLMASKNTKTESVGPSAHGNPQRLLELLESDLILPDEELVLGRETTRFIKKNKIKRHVAISSNIVSCLARSVQEDAGVAFLPMAYMGKEIRRGSLGVFGPKQGFWNHSLYVYSRKVDQTGLPEALAKIIQDLAMG
jgi:LysR family transcriptional activator of nhaA